MHRPPIKIDNAFNIFPSSQQLQLGMMSTTRLTFLYPHLFRSIRASEPISQTVRLRVRPAQRQCCKTRTFATLERRRQRFLQRHGKAVEPFIPEGDTADGLKVFTPEEDGKDVEKGKELKQKGKGSSGKEAQERDTPTTTATESNPSSTAPLSDETQAAAQLRGNSEAANETEQSEVRKEELTRFEQAAANTSLPQQPLETVLEMPPPESPEEENAAKPPHLQTPPYVHHFDTFTLVKQVEAGGFTEDQSITAMKAVRGLLALNLGVAKAGLVSKSDVENVRLFYGHMAWDRLGSSLHFGGKVN